MYWNGSRHSLNPGLEVHRDLPAGGSRVLQSANGYNATFVAGTRTRINDADTGEPGMAKGAPWALKFLPTTLPARATPGTLDGKM